MRAVVAAIVDVVATVISHGVSISGVREKVRLTCSDVAVRGVRGTHVERCVTIAAAIDRHRGSQCDRDRQCDVRRLRNGRSNRREPDRSPTTAHARRTIAAPTREGQTDARDHRLRVHDRSSPGGIPVPPIRGADARGPAADHRRCYRRHCEHRWSPARHDHPTATIPRPSHRDSDHPSQCHGLPTHVAGSARSSRQRSRRHCAGLRIRAATRHSGGSRASLLPPAARTSLHVRRGPAGARYRCLRGCLVPRIVRMSIVFEPPQPVAQALHRAMEETPVGWFVNVSIASLRRQSLSVRDAALDPGLAHRAPASLAGAECRADLSNCVHVEVRPDARSGCTRMSASSARDTVGLSAAVARNDGHAWESS